MQTSSISPVQTPVAPRRDVSQCFVRYFDKSGQFKEESKRIDSHESREHLTRFLIWCVNNNIEVRISPL